MGILCGLLGHKWNGCTCGRCGEKRDEGHEYVVQPDRCAQVCKICEASQRIDHDWDSGKCRHCGMFKDFEVKDGCALSYTGNDEIVVIPEGVRSIGTQAFIRNSTIKTISLPSEITKIYDSIFFRCVNLQGVSMPGVTTIGSNTFSECVSLADIDLSNVTEVGSNTFRDCIRLKRIDLSAANEIAYKAFCNCSGLSEVIVGANTKINFDDTSVPKKHGFGSMASFVGCSNLKELKLPDGRVHPDTCRLLSLHTFDGCTCTRCGVVDIKRQHRFEDGRCRLCGRNEEKYLGQKDALIRTLQSNSNWEARCDAAKDLIYYSASDSLKALITALSGDKHQVVRSSCAEALGEIGDASAVEPLITALGDAESRIVMHAAKALGKIGDARAVEPLLGVLRLASSRYKKDYEPVEKAIEALSRFGGRAVPRLLEFAKDEPEHLRQAIKALEPVGDVRALPLFLTNIKKPGCEVAVANGIANVGDASACIQLAEALGESGTPEIVEAIKRAMAILGVDLSGTKDASLAAKRRFLENLKRIKPGMSEDEADELVGAGVFQMGPNVIHKTPYGEFQLLVSNGVVTGTLHVDGLIGKLEAELRKEGTN